MVSVWDRSRAVGGCFTMLRRTDFVCLSIAYSVTVWFWKCWLCFCLLCFSCHCAVTPGTIKHVLVFLLRMRWPYKMSCMNALRNTNLRLFTLQLEGWCSSLSTHVLTLFGFGSGSYTVVNIMLYDLSSGQMIWLAHPLSFAATQLHNQPHRSIVPHTPERPLGVS